ncbi:MAG: ribonuclease P protein component [Candidatus Paceibacterota bacterium]
MLPKKHRLNKDILKKVLKFGKRFDSQAVYLKVIHTKDNNPTFSFVVSKKTAKSAVKRNTIKRRARHIVWKNIGLFVSGATAVYFFKPGSEKLKSKELEKEILGVSRKANII